ALSVPVAVGGLGCEMDRTVTSSVAGVSTVPPTVTVPLFVTSRLPCLAAKASPYQPSRHLPVNFQLITVTFGVAARSATAPPATSPARAAASGSMSHALPQRRIAHECIAARFGLQGAIGPAQN